MKATLTADQLKQAWIDAYLLNAERYSPYAWAKTDPAFLEALAVTINRSLSAEGDIKES